MYILFAFLITLIVKLIYHFIVCNLHIIGQFSMLSAYGNCVIRKALFKWLVINNNNITTLSWEGTNLFSSHSDSDKKSSATDNINKHSAFQ